MNLDIFYVFSISILDSLFPGIHAVGLTDVTFQVEGTIAFSNDRSTWPTDASGHVKECLTFSNFDNVVFTSTGGCIIPWFCGVVCSTRSFHMQDVAPLMVTDRSGGELSISPFTERIALASFCWRIRRTFWWRTCC